MRNPLQYILFLATLFTAACTTTSNTQPQDTPSHYTNNVSFTGDYHLVKDVDEKPRPTKVNPPSYPKHALQQKTAGFAIVHYVVGIDGKPSQIQCSEATDRWFAESAINSVKNNTYTAAILNRSPVPCLVKQNISWSPR